VKTDGTECRFPLPGAGVFDASMKETLISVAKLLEANFDIFLRLPHHCTTDGFLVSKLQNTHTMGAFFYSHRMHNLMTVQ
jgi:hypothetical protein